MNTQEHQRYQRQILLKEFGRAAQEKLLAAKVLVIGAGGLGCPALIYLAAAGVGALGIVDFDTVDISNLHRQTLFAADDVGIPKTEAARKSLKALNPDVILNTYHCRLDKKNALEIISGYDCVIDGSDNFPTRYLVNDACALLGKPLVYGSVFRFEGQICVFNVADPSGTKTTYRDLFPSAPAADEVPSCEDSGVIGVMPGIVGVMQASETIKLITGIGSILANRLLTFNILENSFYEISIAPSNDAPPFGQHTPEEFHSAHSDELCGAVSQNPHTMTAEQFDIFFANNGTALDVREPNELPALSAENIINIPLGLLKEHAKDFAGSGHITAICQHGTRSKTAAAILARELTQTKISALQGGIVEWMKYRSKKK